MFLCGRGFIRSLWNFDWIFQGWRILPAAGAAIILVAKLVDRVSEHTGEDSKSIC